MVNTLNTPRTGELLNNRIRVQHELTKHMVDIDRTVFKKTPNERLNLSVEKSRHKVAKKSPGYAEERNQLVERMLQSKTPKWGDSFRLKMESL